MQSGPGSEGGRRATLLRSGRWVVFPTFAIAVVLVVLVAALASIPSGEGLVRSWWGSTALGLLMLVGYGAAVGSLGASTTVHARTTLGRLVDAFSAEGWIGRWLTPESERRAWAALAVKTAATLVLVGYLVSQGTALTGWGQSAIVALLVIVLLALESFVPFSDLRQGAGLAGRLRVSTTSAMAAVGVLVAISLLLLALLRPLTLVGISWWFWRPCSRQSRSLTGWVGSSR